MNKKEAIEILEAVAEINKDTYPKIAEAAAAGAKAIEKNLKVESFINDYEIRGRNNENI